MIRTILLSLFLASVAQAFAGDDVAKAIIVRGKALAQSPDGKVVQVTQGMWFKEGTQLRTEDKSFVKLLFVDKSQMNLGPSSQMKIDTFPKNDPGIVTLVKGQLRSKVTKNYMEMDNKEKSKLFIKTKTAAMGVRGTDFQVNYNPENNFTSLVTFEGAVAMASLDVLDGRNPASLVDQRALERIVSSDQAVTVTRGQFSGASPETGAATIPVKINPIQLETMEKDESGTSEATVVEAPKPVRSIVPPGVKGADFSNKPKVETQVSSKVSATASNNAKAVTQGFAPSTKVNTAANGAVVDVSTGKLLLPPKNAPMDVNTGVPMITGASNVIGAGGKIIESGLSKVDVVVVELKVADNVARTTLATNDGRSPASSPTPGTNPLLAPPPPPPPAAGDINTIDPSLAEAGQDVLADTQDNISDARDLGIGAGSTTTRVNLDFNVQ